MKRLYPLLLLVALLLVSSTLKAQMPFYYPNGKKYKGKAGSIGELNQEMEKHGRVYIYSAFSDDEKRQTLVGYKLFTKEPLWVFTGDTTAIKEAIDDFDLDELLGTWRFESELKRYVKKGVIDDGFLLETLGKPESMTKYFSNDIQFQKWNYVYPNVMFTLKKGIVTSYVVTE